MLDYDFNNQFAHKEWGELSKTPQFMTCKNADGGVFSIESETLSLLANKSMCYGVRR